MKYVIINGKFMESRMQGLVRYARELLAALDTIIDNEKLTVCLAVSKEAKGIPCYENIKVKCIGKHHGVLWEQTDFRAFVNNNKDAICLNLCNVRPLLTRPGITAILDIMYKVNPSHYTTIRNRISRCWHILQYNSITKNDESIITISNFCKGEIEKYYPQSKGKITVIPCGWQHVNAFKESNDWQGRYPFLQSGNYYFSLATLSKNKNGKWIMDVAKENPKAVFAVAGKYYETEYSEIPDNVHMLGFVSDEDSCALIKNCKAFIFPSLYEGFGLPPVEALALGAKVISSNSTSLPEVLGNSVHYIDPKNAYVDLESILKKPIEASNKVLERYSWEKSAKILYKLLLNE